MWKHGLYCNSDSNESPLRKKRLVQPPPACAAVFSEDLLFFISFRAPHFPS
jgi:hypothetical protein